MGIEFIVTNYIIPCYSNYISSSPLKSTILRFRNDEKTAQDYKVQGGSVLHLVLALRGGLSLWNFVICLVEMWTTISINKYLFFYDYILEFFIFKLKIWFSISWLPNHLFKTYICIKIATKGIFKKSCHYLFIIYFRKRYISKLIF